jgi:hypothetical protein
MFTAALFTITKLWKQPKQPTIDEIIKKMWYLYTFIWNFIVIKKNEILSFAGKWMELEIILSEVSQVSKVKGCICLLSYVEYRPNTNTNMIYTHKYLQDTYSKVGLVEETKRVGKGGKKDSEQLHQWLKPVILVTQEAEIRRITI